MEITEVRVKLVRSGPDKLHAFCSLTVDNAFVIRDLKVIEGSRGYFVAMPSRKLTDRCPRCDGKNHLRARFCNECGARLPEDRAEKDELGRARLHVDIAHPINTLCRDAIQKKVLVAFRKEMDRTKQTDYAVSTDPFPDKAELDEKTDNYEAAAEEVAENQEREDSFGKGLF